jgi:predicted kinase
MIVFLTGPTGAGKTDTGWGLVSALDSIVFLDCDWFASRSPFSWENPADVASVYRAIRSQMDFHIGEGRNTFVVTLTLEMAAIFQTARAGFADLNLRMFAFRLFAAPATIERRILERARPQSGQEMANAISQQTTFEKLFPDSAIFQPVDTGGLESGGVASLIVQRIRD